MNEPKLIIEDSIPIVPVLDEIVIDTTTVPQTPKPNIQIFELLSEGDSRLLETSDDFDFNNPLYNANVLASRLVETAKKYNALGLSAIQVGVPLRVFVAGSGDNYVAFFNPSIKDVSEDMVHLPEGCLSFPDLFLHITRPEHIHVEYYDWEGNKHENYFSGMTARTFLHEFDHLNGVLFTEKSKPLALSQGKKRRKKHLDKQNKMWYNMLNSLKTKR